MMMMMMMMVMMKMMHGRKKSEVMTHHTDLLGEVGPQLEQTAWWMVGMGWRDGGRDGWKEGMS